MVSVVVEHHQEQPTDGHASHALQSTLALAKELMVRGVANQDVFRQVGVFGRREEFLACARRTDAHALARKIERIAAADLAIKSSIGGGGPRGSRLQLELLICELAT